jgi:hypothetical protein
MSDLAELLIGVTLILISFGLLIVLHPQRGKTTISLVKMPFVGPFLGALITAGFGVGILLLASYFTTIDDLKMSGKRALLANPQSISTN